MLALLLVTLSAAPPPPPGMVLIPGGSFTRGRAASRHPDETPVHRVTVSPFFLDETLVTVARFRRFVDETHHRTSAEVLGHGMTAVEGMADWEWEQCAGASWRAPWGEARAKDIPLHEDWPVVMVSWNDADAFCRHQGQRLPTEAEWEYAMRAGATTRYPWGESPQRPDGGYGLNFWQGDSHAHNTRADGYLYLSPVKAFAPNAFGVFDPVGNVWQWVQDWYASDTYARSAPSAVDPHGPSTGDVKVSRGGSWWCSKGTCSGFGLVARGKSLPDAPYANNGFRCALSAPSPR
ncbi:MAG: formylglycine-generating enzyme family protein [Myxococcaceae bacterium]|nr:formylglycine-generating enzyme family protein [Myxococcaceae bacterium]